MRTSVDSLFLYDQAVKMVLGAAKCSQGLLMCDF